MRVSKLFLFSLLLGLLLSTYLAIRQSQQNHDFLDEQARQMSEHVIDQVQQQMERYQYGLRGARGLVIGIGADQITREAFLRYSLSRDLKTEFPGARGIGFIRRVREADLDQFLAAARADGAPDFRLRQLQPHTGEHYVIQYIEPQEPNKVAIGLDVASEVNRRTAALKSMRDGVPALSAPITLVQSTGVKNQSFLLLQPIYKTPGKPATVEGREQDLVGWTYAPLSMPEVLAKLELEKQNISIRLSDVEAGVATTIYGADKALPPDELASHQKHEFLILGRTWQIEARLKPAFIEQQHQLRPKWIFALGVLFSVLLASLLEIWQRAARQRQALVAEQAQLAAIVSSSSDAIISKSLEGVVTSWNSGATTLFGYAAEEAVGQKLVDLIVPKELRHQENFILSSIAKGEKIRHFQTQRQHKDGHILEVSVNVSPIVGRDGLITGASKTVRDISDIKDQEQRMLVMNIMLEKQVADRTEALEQARGTLQTVLDAVPSVIAYCNRELVYQFANRAVKDWYGLDPDSIRGTHIVQVIGPGAFGAAMPHINAVLSGENPVFEYSMPRADGQGERHAQIHYLPDVEQGEVRGFYIMMYDISEVTNKRLELAAAMRENEALLSTINKKMLSSVATAHGDILSVNDNFCKASGYSLDELVGKHHNLLNSGVHPASMWKNFWETLKDGQSWRGEICNRSKDGQLFWLDAVISPFHDAYGNVDRYVGLYTDITLKKEAEEEIRRLNVLFGNVLKAASEVAIIATDIDGVITIFNAGAERMLNYSADELVGKSTPAVFHVAEEVIARGKELTLEYGLEISGFRTFVHKPELEGAEVREWTYVRKNGSHLTVSLAVTAIIDEQQRAVGYLGVATDVTQQRAQQRQLAFASEQLAKAAKVADLGVWSWVIADNSLEWNERMFDMYGQPRELKKHGLTYQHWRSRVHEDDVQAAETNLNEAVAGHGVYDIVFRLRQPDGRIQYIQAGGLVERDEQGVATRVTGINRDITAQRELETQLRLAKQNADDASASKSRFLANMSHEIRTPMNAVLGMLQLIQQTQLTNRQQDYIVKAHTAAKSLLGLLNDILDFSKIDAGKLDLDLHPFEFEGLMQDLGVILSGNQGEKDVEVLFDLSADLPSTIIGDRLRLQQILINLAGNALKFTQKGHVIVRVKLLSTAKESVNVRISIEDTGIGISKEQLSRIFDGFVQAEASTTRRFGGTGLGLVISKRLIEMMGGELQVSSVPGEGACFYFDLCLQVGENMSPPPKTMVVPHNMRILVVDDNPMVTDIMLNTVQGLGWQADKAHSGDEALSMYDEAIAENHGYELILMDWRMPGLDGLDTASQMRQRPDAGKTPIIIMVSAHGSEILNRSSNLSPQPYYDLLTKPVTPAQLLQMVQRAMSGSPVEVKETMKSSPARKQRLTGIHLLVVEDNALNRQVARELLTGEGAIVELAEGGTEGVAKVTSMQQPYDLVLMDVQMPDMDGHEATRRIRADGRFATLPILAATADAAPADRDACLAAGMNAHIGKPIDLEEIVPAILGLLGRKQLRSPTETKESAPSLAPAAPTHPPTGANAAEGADAGEIEDLKTTLVRFGNQLPMYLSIFDMYEPESNRLMDKLEDALEQGSSANAKVAAHSLKGIAATVGAIGLSRRAAGLETLIRSQPNTPLTSLLNKEIVNELRQLFKTSLAALTTAVESYSRDSALKLPYEEKLVSSPAATQIGAERNARLHMELTELLPLVKANNLVVIDKLEKLYNNAGESDRSRLQTLVKQINLLDFVSAAHTITGLIDDK